MQVDANTKKKVHNYSELVLELIIYNFYLVAKRIFANLYISVQGKTLIFGSANRCLFNIYADLKKGPELLDTSVISQVFTKNK